MFDQLDPVLQVIRRSQHELRLLLEAVEASGGLTLDAYVRYLSMQYHLTKGCQRPFLTVAAHADLGRRRALRRFIANFANEEEFHYELAARDVAQCRRELLPMPFDVELWWAYFDRVVVDRPFLRLGAACILENISAGSRDIVARLFQSAEFIRAENTVFLRIHQHEELPHGDQILEVLSSADLDEKHYADLFEGAEKAATLYQRMAYWAVQPALTATAASALLERSVA